MTERSYWLHASRGELTERLQWLESERDRERSLRVYDPDGVIVTQEQHEQLRARVGDLEAERERLSMKCDETTMECRAQGDALERIAQALGAHSGASPAWIAGEVERLKTAEAEPCYHCGNAVNRCGCELPAEGE